MKDEILKYLTPQIITMITVLGILSILIIISIFLLIFYRKSSFVQKVIWNIREMRDLLSNNPSYYSQKRIKSSIAFYSAELLIVFYDYIHRNTLSAAEIASHAVILFGIAGYHLSKTQEEKLTPLASEEKVKQNVEQKTTAQSSSVPDNPDAPIDQQ